MDPKRKPEGNLMHGLISVIKQKLLNPFLKYLDKTGYILEFSYQHTNSVATIMMFESEGVSYRVSEVFEKFKHEFPKIVMVSQGFYGENVTDTFDRDQVIRIHTYSSQRRVVAVSLEETDQKLGHYSIPIDYPLKFCMKKGSKLKGKYELSLGEIIEKNKLPVEVQFAKSEKVTLGPKSCSTSRFPALRLIHTFDELYMLGNFINNGVMDPRYVPIPLYLKDLRLSLVKGIKGRTAAHWKSFQDELTSIANTALRYDLNYGREGIAVYADTMKEDTIYEELQPDLYAETYDFVRYQMEPSGPEKEIIIQSSSVEKMTEELRHKLKPATQIRSTVSDKIKRGQGDISVSDKSNKSPDDISVSDKSKRGPGDISVSDKSKRGPDNISMLDKSMRSPDDVSVSYKSKRSPDDISVPNNSPPDIPPRNPKKNVAQVITPSKQLLLTSKREVTATYSNSALPDDIEQYSIKDVTEALKLLKLEKYIPAFVAKVIDGRMLQKLDETILKDELNFTRIEALRFMDFVKNGHISK
ncbi:hypothetical protein CHS0354_003913 [Potamilus streckersoni]|uniref:SAM domain-containing protein n=1 Tax=Potamilus streckersoni TaxID=2493646 RepID=A0AAE0S3M8_9BIVA|nr:hypothetical protein CHS0354_003913 [Potamilus streckersoni]